MGLAPYGDPKYKDLILDKIIDVKEDGSFNLNLEYFDFMVGLNYVANGKILKESGFKNVWIQPAAGDAGRALGAALAYYHIGLGKECSKTIGNDKQKSSLLGPEFSNQEIEKFLTKVFIIALAVPKVLKVIYIPWILKELNAYSLGGSTALSQRFGSAGLKVGTAGAVGGIQTPPKQSPYLRRL